jgi:hypothetical protein
MDEILQAEIVAYSSTTEFFVNGLSPALWPTLPVKQCNLIDILRERLDCLPNKAFGGYGLWKN